MSEYPRTPGEKDHNWREQDPQMIVVAHPSDAPTIQGPPTMIVLLHPHQKKGVVRMVSRLDAIHLLAERL